MIFYTPKNFKRGRLIFNRFRPIDIVIFAVGVAITVIAILLYILGFDGKNILILCIMCLPASIALTLILPFQVYHNLMEFMLMLLVYTQTPKRFIWEGVYKYEEEKTAAND